MNAKMETMFAQRRIVIEQDVQCERWKPMLPHLMPHGRFSGYQFRADGLVIDTRTFDWYWDSEEASARGKGLPSFLSYYLSEQNGIPVTETMASYIIEGADDPNSNTVNPLHVQEVGRILHVTVTFPEPVKPAMPMQDQQALFEQATKRADILEQAESRRGLIMRVYNIVDCDGAGCPAELMDDEEWNDTDYKLEDHPFFHQIRTMIHTVRTVEQAVVAYVKTHRLNLDISTDAMYRALRAIAKILPEYNDAVALLPVRSIDIMCYQLAKLATLHPTGQRTFPKARPLEFVRVVFDYPKLQIERIRDRPEDMHGRIKLPKLEQTLYLKFYVHQYLDKRNKTSFAEAVPTRGIQFVSLAVRRAGKHVTHPDRRFDSYTLVAAFNPKKPQTVLQARGRKALVDPATVHRLAVAQDMNAAEIATALGTSVRTVQRTLKHYKTT